MGWWANVDARLGPQYDERVFDEFFGSYVGLLTGWNNQSEIYVARWNTNLNQSFNSTAQRFFCVRAQHTGVWEADSSTVMLVNVENTPNDTLQDQGIMHGELDLANLYLPLLREYDPKTSSDQWTGRPVINNTYTESTIVASMLWSRQTSELGVGNPIPITGVYYWVYDDVRKLVPTLKRSWGLLLLLLLNPLLVLCGIAGKLVLYSVPVGEGFNVVALMAAVDASSLKALRGAGLTGRLTQRVPLMFDVLQSERKGNINLVLNKVGRAGRHFWQYSFVNIQ